MKKLLIVTIIFLSSGKLFSQIKDFSFKITNYEINGVNYDEDAINGDLALTFYKCDNEDYCMSNFFRKTNSQSYGSIHSLKTTHYDETEKMHEIDEYQFTWKFFNTYDSNRGEAAVTLTYIYIGNTVKMTAEIVVLETNEILIFKGYLEK
jgi:hypothetical protein